MNLGTVARQLGPEHGERTHPFIRARVDLRRERQLIVGEIEVAISRDGHLGVIVSTVYEEVETWGRLREERFVDLPYQPSSISDHA